MDTLTSHLITHDFRTLFIERLGWDRTRGATTATADGLDLSFEVIAHKRGFKVIHCVADRYTMFNRGRLRALQRQLLRVAHEHIVIYSCDDPRKQVWQWAVRMPDGRRLRHREHPFFSATPPESLVARLIGLRFALAEEDRVTLVDALDRVRSALDTQSEHDLFVRRPGISERSDRLALAMRDGGEEAFHAFVLFHRRLARWGTKRLQWWFGMEEDEAEQIGMVAVLRAAAQFKPELGYQFSTYATPAIQQQCERDGPAETLRIGMPAIVFWSHVRLVRRLESLEARSGPRAIRRYLDWMTRRDPRFGRNWARVARAINVQSLSDRGQPEYREARQIPASSECRSSWTESAIEGLRQVVDSLPPAEARIIRLRYGFDGEAMTLKEIGDLLGLTRERIRQRQVKSESAIRTILASMLGEPARTDDEDEGQDNPPVAPDDSTDRECVAGITVDFAAEHSVDSRGDDSQRFELRATSQTSQGALFAHAH